jgi:hypothetical protein
MNLLLDSLKRLGSVSHVLYFLPLDIRLLLLSNDSPFIECLIIQTAGVSICHISQCCYTFYFYVITLDARVVLYIIDSTLSFISQKQTF